MAVTVEDKIARAIETRLLTLDTDLSISWPGTNFTPPDVSQGYLAVSFIPNGAQRLFIGSDEPHRFIGMVQVSVFWPKGQGEFAPRAVAGDIVALFPCDLRLTQDDVTVRITKRPDIAGALIPADQSRSSISITIEFEAFA